MELVSGIVRNVKLRQESNRLGTPLPDFLEVQIRCDESRYGKTVEIRIQPLPVIKLGDVLVMAYVHGTSERAVAYMNRSNGMHGREVNPLWLFVRFGMVATLITVGLVAAFGWIGTLTIPLVGLIYLSLWQDELQSRRALELVLARAEKLDAEEKEAARLQEKKKEAETARQQAETARQQAETARRAKVLPVLLAIEDHHQNWCGNVGWPQAEKAIRAGAVPGDPMVFDALLATLTSPDVGKRALAAYALGILTNPDAIPALLKKYHGPPPADFEEALSYDEQQQRDVRGMVSGSVLLDEERRVRDFAAVRCGLPVTKILERFTGKFLKDLIDARLLDPSAAVKALFDLLTDKFRQSGAVNQLDAIASDWPNSAEARAIVPSLLPLLADADEWLAVETAKILCRIRDPRALAPLQARAKDRPEIAAVIAYHGFE